MVIWFTLGFLSGCLFSSTAFLLLARVKIHFENTGQWRTIIVTFRKLF